MTFNDHLLADEAKALVERLRDDWPEILVEKHWMMDSDAIDKQRAEAADRIEALEADKARLRHALENATALIGHRMPMTETALVAGETLTASDVWRAGCDALRK